jgi:hypothetical protein
MLDVSADLIRKEILVLIEETFVSHHGIYTDRGTSLFETLEEIDYSLASRKHAGIDETIAGHVFHLKYYLIVLQEYMSGKRTGSTDWSESWVIRDVDEKQWQDLKAALGMEYENLVGFMNKSENWSSEDFFEGALGILAHSAYHLGAIRQLKDV